MNSSHFLKMLSIIFTYNKTMNNSTKTNILKHTIIPNNLAVKLQMLKNDYVFH